MTLLQRIDVFVEDPVVMNYVIKNNHEFNQIKAKHCFAKIPFYTAISPNNLLKSKWVKFIDEVLREPRTQQLYLQDKELYQ